jgi:response regulator RpfG family c-di-GMP phosphodiesterase
MFRRFRSQQSIRTKLSWLVFLSVGVALLLSSSLAVWHETRQFLHDQRQALIATGAVFSAAVSEAVAARDVAEVLKPLRAISELPGFVHVQVEDPQSEILTQIGSAVRLSTDVDVDAAGAGSILALLTSWTVQVSVPVIHGGQNVGRVLLTAETSGISGRLNALLLRVVVSALFAIGTGLYICLRLQHSITAPLVALSQTMMTVERTHDYTVQIDTEGDRETSALATSFNRMISEIRSTTNELASREAEIILRLSRATEHRDSDTGNHILRMASICRIIARGLGLDQDECDIIYRAAPLHDVGKIAVPDSILFRNGRLDDHERRAIEQHAQFGYEILRDSTSTLIQRAAEIALTHHERWDGTGYPRRLKGEEIPLSGRIAAVADVCDALASRRPYKAAWPLKEVREHLAQSRGTQFDPRCVNALLVSWDEVLRLYVEEGKTKPSLEAA